MFVGKPHQHLESLKNHRNQCEIIYTTYILVDKVSNEDYYATNSNKTGNKYDLSTDCNSRNL